MKCLFSITLAFLLVGTLSCSDKYQAFKSNYTFKSASGGPDYTRLDYWAAHPWKPDPSDSIPAPLRKETRDSLADVFFLHPTTFTIKKNGQQTNARIDDDYTNAKTDYSTILYQASVFNQHCRVFAPRYRQAHINAFFSFSKAAADSAFTLAYTDIKAAFEYYLQHYNKGRPIIIAGHSQGAKMAEWLLRDYFENKPLQQQLVVAYIVGWPLPDRMYTALPLCTNASQTGCLCSWRTFRKGYRPSYIKRDSIRALVTNPLSWTNTGEAVPRAANKGSVLTRYNKVYKGTTDAQISNGVLWVRKPQFPWSFLYFTRNYHVGDINLFYLNMRENIEQRIRRHLKTEDR